MKSALTLVIAMLLGMSLAQATLSVSPQDLENHTVSIDAAALEQDGFIVVHAFDMAGELVLTPPLGLIYLEAGDHTGVMIDLDPVLLEENGYGTDAKNVLPMIHVDANANGSYEFPEGEDVPVMVNDAMVVAELPITYAMMAMTDETMTNSMTDMMMEEVVGEGTFDIMLSGSQEVPPVMTDASGSVTVTLIGNVLSLTGDFDSLSSPVFPIADTPAHIHMGAVGENGDPVVLVNVDAAADGMSGLFSVEAELNDEQLAAFKAGQFYLNIHSEMHQGGELRAQLVPQDVFMMMSGTPSLMVSPQMASTISLDTVTLAEDGFVVVHAFDSAGELVLTPPLGVTYLTAGTHENVTVALDETLLAEYGYGMTAKDVLPMLHVDANANGVYEFPEGGDVPVMVNEDMVVATVSLTF